MRFCVFVADTDSVLETALKMIFLFLRWDMLVFWRVHLLTTSCFVCAKDLLLEASDQSA